MTLDVLLQFLRSETGIIWAEFDKPVRMYRGSTLAGCIKDERYHKPSREFVGGYYMQTMALGLSFFSSRLANNLDFAGWDREFTGTMEAYQCIAGMYLAGPSTHNLGTCRLSQRPCEGF